MANAGPGQDVVISTVALVMESFIDLVKSEVSGVKVVYDENLSYESAVEKFRANNETTGEDTSFYPMFAFRRSVLRHAEVAGPGKRALSSRALMNLTAKGQNEGSNVYRILHGEFDIDFLFITKSVRAMEEFEILYLGEEGISSKKEIEVPLEEIGGPLRYFATYLDLEDKQFESDQNYFKLIQGRVTVRGFYPVLRGTSKHILSIEARIRDFLTEVYANINITA